MYAALLASLVLVSARAAGAAAVAAAAAPAKCPPGNLCLYRGELGPHTHVYSIEGGAREWLVYLKGDTLRLTCNNHNHKEVMSLGDLDLPVFETALQISTVCIVNCGINNSVVEELARLNVTVVSALQLKRLPASDLDRLDIILSDLNQLRDLQISVPELSSIPREALNNLTCLESLYMENLYGNITWPNSIEHLELDDPQLVQGLEGLTKLVNLVVRDRNNLEIVGGVPESVEVVEVWNVPAPGIDAQLFRRARRMRELTWRGRGAYGPGKLRLPPGWLANLPALRRLHLADLTELELPPDLFWNSSALETLILHQSSIRELPQDLLKYATKLTELDISNNQITGLPRDLLPRSLRWLDASNNALGGSLGAALVRAPALRVLNITRNPLGDLCPGDVGVTGRVDVSSWLSGLPALCELRLRGVNATRLCRDWRQMPHVHLLDLRDNHIDHFSYEDLWWQEVRFGDEQCPGYDDQLQVALTGNPINTIDYIDIDFDHDMSTKRSTKSSVVIELPPLHCSCNLSYWLRAAEAPGTRASRVPLQDVRLRRGGSMRSARCVSGRALREPLVCEGSGEAGGGGGGGGGAPGCPRGCRCRRQLLQHTWLDQLDCSIPEHISMLESELAWVRLEHAGLWAVPPLPAAVVNVSLANNRITTIADKDLHTNLTFVDLRNNSLSSEASWARSLLTPPRRRALLAPLRSACDCSDLELRRLLYQRKQQIEDYKELECASGQLLSSVVLECAGSPEAWLGAALGSLCAVLVALVAVAVRFRRHVKALLWSLKTPLPDNLELDYTADKNPAVVYDVFLSYAHVDRREGEAAWRGLEAAGWRVVAAARDWAPGGWLPAQVSRSVGAARRTLALASPAAARSHWCRAETELAIRRRRLVLILLPPYEDTLKALEKHAPETYAYAKRTTYLEFDDEHLWQKIDKVLRVNGHHPTTPENDK